MAYEVTATRRRPKTFDEMSGQEFVVTTLKSSIETGRIAHAYLFSGPRGCGKTSAARILARSLNCEKGPTASPCGVCSSCQEIARGASLDVIEIDGASNTSVNDVRQIKDEVLFPPNSGKYKIYIIDEVHMLSNSAFNALLKTIEEPPPYIIFIFATTELHKVPATIKSRCQQFSFRLFSVETIKSQLAAACAELGLQAEDEALFWIAKEATGSLRDAYTLFDQVVSFSDGKLTAALIRDKLGLVGLDAVNELATLCVSGKGAEAIESMDAILHRGVSIEQFIIDLTEYFRSVLLLKSGIQKESLLGYAPERFAAAVVEGLNVGQLERGVSLLLDAYRDIRYSVSPRFELEVTISRLCSLSRWISANELRAAVDGVRGLLPAGEQLIASKPVNHAPTQTAEAPLKADFSRPGAIGETFKRMIAEKSGASAPASAAQIPAPAVQSGQAPAAPEKVAPAPDPESADSQAPDARIDTDDDPVLLPPHRAPPLDIEGLRKSLIAALGKERGVLVSGLAQTGPWTVKDGRVVISAADSLAAQLLQKDHQILTQELTRLAGTPLGIEIAIAAKQDDAGSNKGAASAEHVEMVRQLFKGTIVRS